MEGHLIDISLYIDENNFHTRNIEKVYGLFLLFVMCSTNE